MMIFAGEINESDKVFMASCDYMRTSDRDADAGGFHRNSLI